MMIGIEFSQAASRIVLSKIAEQREKPFDQIEKILSASAHKNWHAVHLIKIEFFSDLYKIPSKFAMTGREFLLFESCCQIGKFPGTDQINKRGPVHHPRLGKLPNCH
jgi:hypothetical protein